MTDQAGYDILRSLQRQWKWQGFCYCLLIAMAGSLLLTALLWWFLSMPPIYGALIFLAFFSLSLYTIPYWRLSVADTARFLDQNIPELEDSCGLLLMQPGQLGALQQLQADRVAGRLGLLEQLQSVRSGGIMEPVQRPRPLQKKMITAILTFIAAVIVASLIAMNPPENPASLPSPLAKKASAPVEKQAPQIAAVNVRIVPPAYTGRAVRQQPAFALRIEEGAQVSWQLSTSQSVDSLLFMFNDTTKIALKADDKERRSWHLSLGSVSTGFYQIRVNDQYSELYKIEVVKDEPPHITIRHPKPYTIVDLGEPRKIALNALMQDDYAISDASVVATVASGNGEAVKFREQTLRFDRGFNGAQPSYDLDKTIDLDVLGLHPGDELYFFCQAKDNHGQTTRSDMYIISLPDTAQLMSLSGLTSGLDIKPELFRSERQIIIETEQLLKGKDTITQEAFNNKSNDLGIDQKLLRLRYGKFLGEEAEEGGPKRASTQFRRAQGILGMSTRYVMPSRTSMIMRRMRAISNLRSKSSLKLP